MKAFAAKGEKLRFVGGAVRDSLLGIEVVDIDAATSLTPDFVQELLEKSGIRATPTGIKHGTVTALVDGKSFEITTLRRDTACDGRHAQVEYTNDWREDAMRRDFTMNALYLAPDGELFDYTGGVEDAKNGIVRFIGDPSLRIKEDYLRILRLFRFYAYYGKESLETSALEACKEAAPQIANLSGERIQLEMLKLLSAPAPFIVLEMMQANKIAPHIFGFDIKPDEEIDKLKSGELRLAYLLLSAGVSAENALKNLSLRWKLSNEFKKFLSLLVNHINDITPALDTAGQKQLIRNLGAEIFTSLVNLQMALKPQQNYTPMLELSANWQAPLMPVTGADLIAKGIAQGKELGQKLKELETAWEKSDYKLGREELLAAIK
jgi:poly(A) polymerase